MFANLLVSARPASAPLGPICELLKRVPLRGSYAIYAIRELTRFQDIKQVICVRYARRRGEF